MDHPLHVVAWPLAQSALLAAIGLALLLGKRRRLGGGLLACAVLWLWLCATPAFAAWLRDNLAAQHPARPAAMYPATGAIVVAGGGPLPLRTRSWSAARDPALDTPLGFALALYRAGKAPLIVLAGPHGAPQSLAGMLRAQGVPARAIVNVPGSDSTHGDARLAAPALRARGIDRILLVTFPMHMPRTVAVFRRQGLDVVAAPSLASGWKSTVPRWRPGRAALRQSERCLHEYLGLAYYRLRGWAAW